MHYSTLAIIPKTDEYFVQDAIDDLFAPYSENLEVDPYVEMTRDEAVSELGSDAPWSWANAMRDKLAEDGKVVIAGHELTDEDGLEAFIAEVFADDGLLRQVGESWANYEFDEDMNVLSRSNPDAKWDWYEIGGRWGGMLGDSDVVDMADYPVHEQSKHTYHVVLPDGTWHECGELDERDDEFVRLVEPFATDGYLGVLVDVHA